MCLAAADAALDAMTYAACVPIEKNRVEFRVGGMLLRGVLYLPRSSRPAPCVVLANGFSGTMDWIVPWFAERFADAGLAALIFDYRHLGESEGEPRQVIELEAQRADLRAALAFVRRHPAIDVRHIALWGTSLGGSHVVTLAADEPSIAAVVLNMPALDVIAGANVDAKRKALGVSWTAVVQTTLKLLTAAAHDWLRGAVHLSPRYLEVYGKPGQAFFTDPALAENFARVAADSPTWQNRVAARFLLRPPRYREGTIERIAAPMLVCLAAHDLEVSPRFVMQTVAKTKRSRIEVYPVGHFEMYHGEAFRRVVEDQTAFLCEHLKPSPEYDVRSPS